MERIQICNIFIRKFETFDIINQLVQTGADGIAVTTWIVPVEHIKYNCLITVIFKISLHHRKLIEIR